MKIIVNDNLVKFGNFRVASWVRGYKTFDKSQNEHTMLLQFNTTRELNNYEKEKVIQTIRDILNFKANNEYPCGADVDIGDIQEKCDTAGNIC